MSSNGTQITLKTSETTYLWSQITIMVTKTMSDKNRLFEKLPVSRFLSRISILRPSLLDSVVEITLGTQVSLE